MFDEEGFDQQAAAVCPSCRQSLKPGAVLCLNCGYHLAEGTRVAGHQVAGVDIPTGQLALDKARDDMAREVKLQKDMESGAGLPPWMLALILTILVGAATIGVVTINMSHRAAEQGTANTFNPVATLLLFAGICCWLVAIAAQIKVLIAAFRDDVTTGIMVMFIPFYVLYYGFTNWDKIGKAVVTAVVMGGIAGGLFAAAATMVGGGGG